jgi:hypothetical protein
VKRTSRLNDGPVVACPRCRRRVFTRRDFVSTALEGTGQCRKCGQSVRLDLFSRWVMSCAIALTLPAVLLYGDLFYSGHLFVASFIFIFVAWAALAWLCCPALALERTTTSGPPIDRATGMLIVVVLLAAAGIIDNFMAARFETEPVEQTRSTSTAHGQR